MIIVIQLMLQVSHIASSRGAQIINNTSKYCKYTIHQAILIYLLYYTIYAMTAVQFQW